MVNVRDKSGHPSRQDDYHPLMKNHSITPKLALKTAGMLATLLLLLAVVLWLMFQKIPAWYRPIELDKQGIRQAQADSTRMVNWITEKMIAGEPFEIVLHQQSVAEWLAALPHSWPEVMDHMPMNGRDPFLSFHPGVVKIGLHVSDRGVETILNVRVRVALENGSKQLRIRFDEVRGGALTAPDMLMDRILQPALKRLKARDASGNTLEDTILRAMNRVNNADDLRRGITVPNHFIWPNGKRRFRIIDLVMEGGKLRLLVLPIDF